MSLREVLCGSAMLAALAAGGCGPRRVTVVEGSRGGRVTRVHRPFRRDLVVVKRPAPQPAPAGAVVVKHRPPARKVVVRPARPSTRHVWIAGHWQRRGGAWVWKPGRWAVRPRAGAAWVPARWEKTAGGWQFVPGHWR